MSRSTETPEAQARSQYDTTTSNLDARVAIHAFGTNPQSWTQFVRQRLPLDGPGVRVLDVGAGTGVHWQEPLPIDTQLVLADRHAPMCRRLKALEVGRVIQCDATNLPIRDSCADLVTCLHVLYHVDNPALAIAEMLRVVRPGGWLAVATNGPGHMRELDDLAQAVGMPRPISPHLRFSIEDARGALEDAGLTPVVHSYEDELRLPGADPALGYLRSLGEPIEPPAEVAIRDLVRGAVEEQGHFTIGKETALLLAQSTGPG